jgi:predicted transcriptional regulator
MSFNHFQLARVNQLLQITYGQSAVKNYLKITARNRELDDFSYEFYIFMFLFFRATFCA